MCKCVTLTGLCVLFTITDHVCVGEDVRFVFFSCVSLENHILEDVNKCVIALQEGDVDTLDRTAGAIRGRAARVVHIINAEMENYEPGVYTERVLESIKLLSETGEICAALQEQHFTFTKEQFIICVVTCVW